MKFIEDRISGVPWTEASGFDHYLATKKTGRVDAGDGEKQVNKKIREYKKYI